jgi:predicted ester cyclase
MGIPPTGKPVSWTGIDIFRLVEGKIVEGWGVSDGLHLMQQLGALPLFG